MKVGFVQFNPIFGHNEQNINKILELISGLKVKLLVLPELSNSGYMFSSKKEVRKYSESIPKGPATRALISIAEKNNTYIVCGIAEKDKNRYYNSAVLVGPKGYIGKYRKIHLFLNEKKYFNKGNLGFPVFKVMNNIKIGIMICFDWFFPEAMRVLSLKGADIICHCSNLVLPYCQNAMVTRCLENHVFAITANRTGVEKRMGMSIRFTGKSQITGPDGKILAAANQVQETVRIVDINPLISRNKNINSKNNLFKDRQPELYKPIISY